MATVHVALVPDNVQVDPSEVTRVAAAVSRQVQTDFASVWTVSATVDPFTKLEDVPLGYWPVIIRQNVKGAEGYHQDKNGQPFALIAFHDNWSVTASHETLEMLADPFGSKLNAGVILDQAQADPNYTGSSSVEYLVEICDPSEDVQFGYMIDGISVSDFYTPRFFDPVQSPGVRYSFTGAIDTPRKVLNGGYISWHDLASDHWWQLRMFPDQFSSAVPHVLDLTADTDFAKFVQAEGLRGASDRASSSAGYQYWKPKAEHILVAARERATHGMRAQEARARGLRAHIAALIEEAGAKT